MTLAVFGAAILVLVVHLLPEETKEALWLRWDEFVGSRPVASRVLKKKIRIQVRESVAGVRGLKVHGTLRVEYPMKAGLADQRFEIVVPGAVEFAGGESGYEVRLSGLAPSTMSFMITVDGCRLEPGDAFGTAMDETGATFTLKPTP